MVKFNYLDTFKYYKSIQVFILYSRWSLIILPNYIEIHVKICIIFWAKKFAINTYLNCTYNVVQLMVFQRKCIKRIVF